MNPDYCLDVPADFGDSDADAQAHPMARVFFSAKTNAETVSRS